MKDKVIPTAEEFIMKGHLWIESDEQRDDLIKSHIEFARLHVEQALEAAHINMQLPQEDLDFTLSSYPLENIK